MSYILEALKKSQQERELGRVPTLDTSSMFAEDKEPVRVTHWGLISVGLAAVALVIALYAVLRTPVPSPVPPMQVSQESEVPLAPIPAPSPAVSDAEDATVDSATAVAEVAPPPAASRVEQPPPMPLTPPALPAPPAPAPIEDAGIIDDEEMALESELDPWLEQELQRQMDAEQALYAEPPAPRRRPQRAEVPIDLIEDIESFKEQVRREQGIPPPAAPRQPVDIGGDPTKLRLTPVQQARVPAYFMTVHVYDDDPSKRFVHINALRYAEGEETRDGLRVERIIPEGAVLSYLGNPFFVRR